MCVPALVLWLLQSLSAPAALESAIRYGDPALVSALIGCGAPVNGPGLLKLFGVHSACCVRTPLESAILYADPKAVEVLLRAGADVWGYTSAGTLPMQMAFLRGRSDVCALLVKAGAAPFGSTSVRSSAVFYGFQWDPSPEEIAARHKRWLEAQFPPNDDRTAGPVRVLPCLHDFTGARIPFRRQTERAEKVTAPPVRVARV